MICVFLSRQTCPWEKLSVCSYPARSKFIELYLRIHTAVERRYKAILDAINSFFTSFVPAFGRNDRERANKCLEPLARTRNSHEVSHLARHEQTIIVKPPARSASWPWNTCSHTAITLKFDCTGVVLPPRHRVVIGAQPLHQHPRVRTPRRPRRPRAAPRRK